MHLNSRFLHLRKLEKDFAYFRILRKLDKEHALIIITVIHWKELLLQIGRSAELRRRVGYEHDHGCHGCAEPTELGGKGRELSVKGYSSAPAH